MALSVIGVPVLGEVFSPSISRQVACFCYSLRPLPCHKLLRERFSPTAHLPRCRVFRRRSPTSNRLYAGIPISSNQWLTNLMQPAIGSEMTISRLFPHP